MVVGYIVLTTAVGWYLSSRARARNDISSFFVGRKEMGTVLICFTMFGEMIAGSSTVGSAQTAYSIGISSAWTNWGQAVGVFIFIITVSKLYRAAGYHGAYSVSEAFEFRFDCRRCRTVVMVIVLVVYGIIFAMQPKAAANILAPMIGADVTVMTWVMGAVFVIQALVGLKGIAAMNVVHSSFLYIGCLVVGILAWHRADGLDTVREVLGSSYLSVAQPSLGTVVGNAAGSMFAFILSSTLVANIYSAKSKRAAKPRRLARSRTGHHLCLFPRAHRRFRAAAVPRGGAGHHLLYRGRRLRPLHRRSGMHGDNRRRVLHRGSGAAAHALHHAHARLLPHLPAQKRHRQAAAPLFEAGDRRHRRRRYISRHLRHLHTRPDERSLPDTRRGGHGAGNLGLLGTKWTSVPLSGPCWSAGWSPLSGISPANPSA